MNEEHASTHGRELANRLALVCLAHLEQEEAMLAETLDSLREVRSALTQRNFEQLSRALEQQRHTARAAAELHRVRAQLRSKLAAVLRLPAERVTLGRLAEQLSGELRDRLLGYQQRLSHMAAEVDLLNRGNAALVRQSLDLLQKMLVCLTGGDLAADRYAPSGRIEPGACGSVIEDRC